jgi:hypothetical protein
MKRSFLLIILLCTGILKMYAQKPSLPTSGQWDTFGEMQVIHVDNEEMQEKKLPPFDLSFRTEPHRKILANCSYTSEITNISDKEVSFMLATVSPGHPTSSDHVRVHLKAGEKTEVHYIIGHCPTQPHHTSEEKFKNCCNCSFEFEFQNVHVSENTQVSK